MKRGLLIAALVCVVGSRAEAAKVASTVKLGVCLDDAMRVHAPRSDWGAANGADGVVVEIGGGEGPRVQRDDGGIGTGAPVGGGIIAQPVPQPVIKVGDPKVKGKIDRGVIQRVMRTRIPMMARCYEAKTPTLTGDELAEITINANGRVTQSTVTGFDANLSACLQNVAKFLVFPKGDDDGESTATIPLSFAPPPDQTGPTKDDLAWIAAAPKPLAAKASALAACVSNDASQGGAFGIELAVDDKGAITSATISGVADEKIAACMQDALMGVVIAKRAAGSFALTMSCTAALVPAANVASVAGLVAAKTPVLRILKDGSATLDGKAVDAKSFGEGAFAGHRVLVEPDADVDIKHVYRIVWAARDAGATDVRLATGKGKAWTALPLQAFPAIVGDKQAASVLFTGGEIRIGTADQPQKIAKGKRGWDLVALGKALTALAKSGTTLGVEIAADGNASATWGDVAQAMSLAARAGFVLAPFVGKDRLTVAL
jgi:biopolymer transport protein ExbD